MFDLERVKKDGYLLKHIKEQTPELCLAAVKNSGYALQFVKNQTSEICLVAIRRTIYALNHVNIEFDISPIKTLFDKEINVKHMDNNFIKNLFVLKIDKPDLIKQYLIHKKYNIELVKLLQEYNYPFSEDQIYESIKRKVEIPHVHQYGYNLNNPVFIRKFKKHDFYPESYNLDI